LASALRALAWSPAVWPRAGLALASRWPRRGLAAVTSRPQGGLYAILTRDSAPVARWRPLGDQEEARRWSPGGHPPTSGVGFLGRSLGCAPDGRAVDSGWSLDGHRWASSGQELTVSSRRCRAGSSQESDRYALVRGVAAVSKEAAASRGLRCVSWLRRPPPGGRVGAESGSLRSPGVASLELVNTVPLRPKPC
jgi:hypothetical protein